MLLFFLVAALVVREPDLEGLPKGSIHLTGKSIRKLIHITGTWISPKYTEENPAASIVLMLSLQFKQSPLRAGAN